MAVCWLVCLSIGWSVGLSWFHSYTSTLLSEHLFMYGVYLKILHLPRSPLKWKDCIFAYLWKIQDRSRRSSCFYSFLLKVHYYSLKGKTNHKFGCQLCIKVYYDEPGFRIWPSVSSSTFGTPCNVKCFSFSVFFCTTHRLQIQRHHHKDLRCAQRTTL